MDYCRAIRNDKTTYSLKNVVADLQDLQQSDATDGVFLAQLESKLVYENKGSVRGLVYEAFH
jgi:hypothetical protein